jgi:hypothetical protein
MAKVLQLLTASAGFALVVGLLARHLSGDLALLYCLVAVAIVTPPALLTLVLIQALGASGPTFHGMVMLGSSGVRLVLVLLLASVLYLGLEIFQRPAFLLWVGAAYIYVLIVEVGLVLQTLVENRSRTGSEG